MSVHRVTLIALLSMSSAVACTSRVIPGINAHADHVTPFRIHAAGVAATTVRLVESDVAWAEARISDVFGTFPDTVSVHLFPHREQFSAALREAWGIPDCRTRREPHSILRCRQLLSDQTMYAASLPCILPSRPL